MAKNRVYENGQYQSLVCTTPTVPVSGAPVLITDMPGVAVTDERADGTTSVDLGPAVYTLSVTANNGAIAVGAKLYGHAASPVTIDNTVTAGIPFGYALQAVTGGQTASINVRVMPHQG